MRRHTPPSHTCASRIVPLAVLAKSARWHSAAAAIARRNSGDCACTQRYHEAWQWPIGSFARVLRAAPASAQLVAAASRARAHARGSATCAGGHRAGAWEGALGRHPLAGVACGGVVVHRAAACAAAFSTNRLRTENHCSRTANMPTGFARALSCLRTPQCPARPTRAQDLAASLPSTAPPHLHGITHTAVCARNSACYV